MGMSREMFGGHRVMKAFNGEARSIEQFEEYNTTLYGVAWKSQFLSGLMMPIMSFISNISYVAVVVVAATWRFARLSPSGISRPLFNMSIPLTNRWPRLANITNVLAANGRGG